MRKTLKVLSALLAYPTAELKAAIPELRRAIEEEAALSEHTRYRLDRIMTDLAERDLLDAQERYVLLFDRTRSLSLHLFEHVHGESRDRGQAMVDLAGLYRRHGLDIGTSELPDYLPLFLEFLSEIDAEEARGLIQEVAHILEAIRLRLKKRKSAYSSVFSACQLLASAETAAAGAQDLLAQPDDNPEDLEALDAAWVDEEVRFGPSAGACGKDELVARVRAGARPAPDMAPRPRQRPVITTPANRAS